jgi:predicted dinucleotide-binding enzyme
MPTIQDLQASNDESIKRMEEAVAEINKLIADPNVSLDDEARLLSRRGSLFAEITRQSIVNAHLKASKVVVAFSKADLDDLATLEEKLDKFIIAGIKINAMLNLIPKLLDTASDIATLITSHTARA